MELVNIGTRTYREVGESGGAITLPDNIQVEKQESKIGSFVSSLGGSAKKFTTAAATLLKNWKIAAVVIAAVLVLLKD